MSLVRSFGEVQEIIRRCNLQAVYLWVGGGVQGGVGGCSGGAGGCSKVQWSSVKWKQ